jgi:hypothetical protein
VTVLPDGWRRETSVKSPRPARVCPTANAYSAAEAALWYAGLPGTQACSALGYAGGGRRTTGECGARRLVALDVRDEA